MHEKGHGDQAYPPPSFYPPVYAPPPSERALDFPPFYPPPYGAPPPFPPPNGAPQPWPPAGPFAPPEPPRYFPVDNSEDSHHHHHHHHHDGSSHGALYPRSEGSSHGGGSIYPRSEGSNHGGGSSHGGLYPPASPSFGHQNSYPPEEIPHRGSLTPQRSLSGQLVRVYCKGNSDYSLGVRPDGVVLMRANPEDEAQQWIKDMTWSTKVKDEKGFPAFVLIHKPTGKALKHVNEELQQVLLKDYRPEILDEEILWTESQDMGEGFRALRRADNIHMNLDAFRGDKKYGGIKDGTPAVLYKWKKTDNTNQLWKIVPLC